MKKRYGSCICHDKLRSLNAKGLCPIGAKKARENSAESKGLTVKKKEDGIDNTRRTEKKKLRIGYNPKKQSVVKDGTVFKKTKIKPISKDKAKELLELSRIKKDKLHAQGCYCEMCGEPKAELDLFHIIGVGDKRFATDERNLMLSCRGCHDIWGANDWSKIVKFKNFSEIMERLKSLDEGKYWKLKHKIDEYYEQENTNTNKD